MSEDVRPPTPLCRALLPGAWPGWGGGAKSYKLGCDQAESGLDFWKYRLKETFQGAQASLLPKA